MDIEARTNWFINDEEKSLGRKLTQNEKDQILDYLESKKHLFAQVDKNWKKNVINRKKHDFI